MILTNNKATMFARKYENNSFDCYDCGYYSYLYYTDSSSRIKRQFLKL